ncbi:unnamed protein product [Heterobilharzia americana]|nr:unnamed protein product [Heterobilharzia americana]
MLLCDRLIVFSFLCAVLVFYVRNEFVEEEATEPPFARKIGRQIMDFVNGEDLEKCKHLCLFGYVFDILKDENFDCMHGVYVNLTGYVPGIYLDPMGEPTNYLEKLMQCWDLIDQENKRLFMMFSKCDLRTDGDQAYGFFKCFHYIWFSRVLRFLLSKRTFLVDQIINFRI